MCFYVDADWYASVIEETEPIADKRFCCHECREWIEAGESYHHVFQQEHETCFDCDESVCSCIDWEADSVPADHECKCEKPNFGEQFTYRCCHNCWKFLRAVEKHELDEGCRPDESRPALECMVESMQEFDAESLDAYFAEAARMFPELSQSGYLERLRKQMSVE